MTNNNNNPDNRFHCATTLCPIRSRDSVWMQYLILLHGGVVLSDLHVVLPGRGILVHVLQDLHGLLPLAGCDGRLDGFEEAAEETRA